MPRFFYPHVLPENSRFDLEESVARHVLVLRLRVGEVIDLFDGNGGEVPATVCDIGRRHLTVETGCRRDVERESCLDITLYQAISMGERMDFTIQKSVELGVNAIQPIISTRVQQRLDGERAAKKREHWRGVAVAACEQSGRNRIPAVHETLTFEALLAQPLGDQTGFILDPVAGKSLRDDPQPQGRIALLIGPEGGLSAEEIQQATAAGWQPLQLGPRVLRTETAALAVIAAMQTVWGDF